MTTYRDRRRGRLLAGGAALANVSTYQFSRLGRMTPSLQRGISKLRVGGIQDELGRRQHRFWVSGTSCKQSANGGSGELHRQDTAPRHQNPAAAMCAGLIDRPRLLDLVGQVQAKQVTVIKAGPGFGKTSLAVAWAEQLQKGGKLIAWLTLDDDDDEPTRFLFYVSHGHCHFGQV
jgi:hypothetical protein